MLVALCFELHANISMFKRSQFQSLLVDVLMLTMPLQTL